MTTILIPTMADNKIKYECLARQVEQIARIVDYDEYLENLGMIKEIYMLTLAKKKIVSYVEMESSCEDFEHEYFKVDLAALKNGSPYVCASLKKVANIDKVSDAKYKGGKKYSFKILKLEQIFDLLLKDK
ncbi:hypothetical protein Ahy_A03g012872 [Arachis hypogaea]|uniref:Uncharacterized protein n=1 Tax=Arachis hypogaea TaxID=3818 RepID=A0A445DUC5_ARAHY|nr:hypothetical protein Ahy_A03g012872 [Arachis hypogaea]